MDMNKFKRSFQLKVLLLPVLGLLNISIVQAKVDCKPLKEVLSGYQNKKLGTDSAKKLETCLSSILYTLGSNRKVEFKSIFKLLKEILPLSKEQAKRHEIIRYGQHLIDYTKIAQIISRLNSKRDIKRYLDFVVFSSGSATEGISYGLAKLYQLNAPELLKLLSAYSKSDQKEIIDRLAVGVINIYYPRVNKSNFKRLIVGIHWDVVNKNYSQRELSLQIEVAVLKILK